MIRCSVDSCKFNERNLCALDNITVNNATNLNALTSSETMCASFVQRHDSVF